MANAVRRLRKKDMGSETEDWAMKLRSYEVMFDMRCEVVINIYAAVDTGIPDATT